MPLLAMSEMIEMEETSIPTGGTLPVAAPSPPVSILEGDFLIAFVVTFVRRSPWSGGSVASSIPGWTTAATFGSTAIAVNGRQQSGAIFYRVADGTSDDAATLTFAHSGTNDATGAAHIEFGVWRGADYEFVSAVDLGDGPSATVTSPASASLGAGDHLMLSMAANLAVFTTPTLNMANGFTEIAVTTPAQLEEVNLMPSSVAMRTATGPGSTSWPQWNATQGDSAGEEHATGVIFREVLPPPPAAFLGVFTGTPLGVAAGLGVL